MKEPTGTRTDTGLITRKPLVAALLACGIFSSLLYVASDLVASATYVGYSYVNQMFSELLALGSPVRGLMLPLTATYNVLVIAFSAGVWMTAQGRRSQRITAVMVCLYGVSSLIGPFVPMHVRGAEGSLTDTLHIVCTITIVVASLLAMAFGSATRGRGFRLYSIASIVTVVAFGVIAGMQGARLAEGLATPWMGIVERVNIYSIMLWMLTLGVLLLRDLRSEPTTARPLAENPKTVAVFVGSARRGGNTWKAARRFLDGLEAFGDVRGEIVLMGDYDLRVCRGCRLCFERGEQFCPLKDDRDVLLGKIEAADAVVFATPNYLFSVSGLMKIFLDRLGFMGHRPRLHGKTASAIVVQGIWGGRKVRDYLQFAAGSLGFKVVKGSVIRTLEPMSEDALRTMDRTLAKHASRFHEQLLRPARPSPSMFELMMFRMGRTGVRVGLPEGALDRTYYQEHGWFESDYFYPTHLGPLKSVAGAFFDWLFARLPMFKTAEEPGATQFPTSPASR